MGESKFSLEVLSNAIEKTKNRILEMQQKQIDIEKQLENEQDTISKIDYCYEQFKSWADEFEDMSLERKKMVSCRLFKEIKVGRGYEITVVTDVTYGQFIGV